jgi:hypothetical protein
MARPIGVVIWEGPSPVDGAPIAFIATGLARPSKNVKTGDMIQTWILRADMSPMDALRTDADESVCGTCPLRGTLRADGKRDGRACYVNVGRAPSSIWRAYQRGTYPRVTPEQAAVIFNGRPVRLGSYGDPAMVPFEVVERALVGAAHWTGYSHQWRTTDPRWAGLLMASCDSADDLRVARKQGWRSFVVVPRHASLPAGSVECAATREINKRLCDSCGMCAGTREGAVVGAVDVAIRAHGPGAKHVLAA